MMLGFSHRLLVAFLLLSSVATTEAAIRLQTSSSTSAVEFQSLDPDSAPVLTSTPVYTLYLHTKGRPGTWTVSVFPRGDLLSAQSVIPISAVTMQTTRIDGDIVVVPSLRLSAAASQTFAFGAENEKVTMNITFQLTNSWAYEVGTYSQTLDFVIFEP